MFHYLLYRKILLQDGPTSTTRPYWINSKDYVRTHTHTFTCPPPPPYMALAPFIHCGNTQTHRDSHKIHRPTPYYYTPPPPTYPHPLFVNQLFITPHTSPSLWDHHIPPPLSPSKPPLLRRTRRLKKRMGSSTDEVNHPLLENTAEPIKPAELTGEAKYYEYSRQLERVLTDTTVPYVKRMVAASCIELKLLFRLAAPAAAVYLINYVMSMFTQIFSGHLGNLELAGASLGNNGIQTFAYGIMVIFLF